MSSVGEPLLLLRLEGPLQSWGLRARWDVRDSAREPTKSGVVGLLAGAMGFGRDDPRIVEELDGGLRMGVRVEREPGLLKDYHTVTGFLPIARGGFKHSGVKTATRLETLLGNPDIEPSTIQSWRQYLTDGAFLVVLAARPSASVGLLSKCAAALERPYWPLFLGRRSCIPARPVLECLSDAYDGLEQALRRHPWSCLGVGGELRPDHGGASRPLRIVVESDQGAPRDDRRRLGAARLYGRRFIEELPPVNREDLD
jgi:CRISPR system Cascade subunit CasD